MVTSPPEGEPAEMASSIPRAPRVLVVDDDEVIRRLIAANLALEGFDVAMAANGQECLDHVSAIAPDVITLDVMTPRLDGWETAIRLRESPETSHIKVVLITARAEDDDRTLDSRVAADAIMMKPFDPGALIRAIRKLVDAPERRSPQSSRTMIHNSSPAAELTRPSDPAAARQCPLAQHGPHL